MPQLLWPCDLPSFKMELKQLQVQKPHKTGRYQEGRSPAQLWNQNACCSVCIGHAKQGCLQTNALAMQGDRRNSASCSHHYVLLPPGRHILHRWTHGKERCYFSQTSCKSRSEIDCIGGLKKAQVLKHREKHLPSVLQMRPTAWKLTVLLSVLWFCVKSSNVHFWHWKSQAQRGRGREKKKKQGRSK